VKRTLKRVFNALEVKGVLPKSMDELDPQFKYEVADQPGGENIKNCFACGVCTGGCPVSEIDPAYDPRKIIRMIILGMKERVLSSDFIWLCSLCNTCSFICPQDVRFSEVMAVLRDMSVKEGFVDPSFPQQISDIDRFSQTIRDKILQAVVDKRAKKVTIEPKKLLKEIIDKL
jgi:heterodisulfide reductase subunit C